MDYVIKHDRKKKEIEIGSDNFLIKGRDKDGVVELIENKTTLTEKQAISVLEQLAPKHSDRETWCLTEPVAVDGEFVLLTYKFVGDDNYGKPKTEYLKRLLNMNEKELNEETSSKIWLSAFAANNPRSDYHWHVDGCYDEWHRRNKGEMYGKIFDRVYKENCG